MNRYAIAFISPGNNLLHRVVTAKSEDEALHFFFKDIKLASYSQDDEGYSYFKEDFYFGTLPAGSVLAFE